MKTSTKILTGFVGCLFLLCVIISPFCITDPYSEKEKQTVVITFSNKTISTELEDFAGLTLNSSSSYCVVNDEWDYVNYFWTIIENDTISHPKIKYDSSLSKIIDIEYDESNYGKECQISIKTANAYEDKINYQFVDIKDLYFEIEVPRDMLKNLTGSPEILLKDFKEIDMTHDSDKLSIENSTIKKLTYIDQ